VNVTDEEMQKVYTDDKGSFKTPEQRKVRYAAFLIPPPADGKTPEESKRNQQLQQMADKAYALREALSEKGANFEELATKAGAKVGKTEFFEGSAPPKELGELPALAEAAFALTPEKPYSPHLTSATVEGLQNGAYVLACDEVKKPEQMTFEAVKSKIKDDLTRKKAADVMLAKAGELRTKIEEAKKAGKTFYEAVEALGRKPVPFPLFGGSAPSPQGAKYADKVLPATRKLAPGQLSEPIAADDATIIVHLDQRTAGDEKTLTPDKLEQSAQMLEGRMRYEAFMDWMTERAAAAGVNSITFR
jgi:hypothetical protein